ncbi:MAG TPA: hypothetical protein DIT61_18995, partial [Pseudomonas sp.]|nr:hypothetical protein [Pseudomonas sp.]
MNTTAFTPRPLTADTFAERWQPRPDATQKVRGELRYPTDELDWPGLLHGRILRSALPHARLLGI